MITRRDILSGVTVLVGGVGLLRARLADAQEPGAPPPFVSPKGPYTHVITPNGATLPWVMKDGAKEFRLVAEPVNARGRARRHSSRRRVTACGFASRT